MHLLKQRREVKSLDELEAYLERDRNSVSGAIVSQFDDDEFLAKGRFTKTFWDDETEVVEFHEKGTGRLDVITDYQIALNGVFIYTRRPIEPRQD